MKKKGQRGKAAADQDMVRLTLFPAWLHVSLGIHTCCWLHAAHIFCLVVHQSTAAQSRQHISVIIAPACSAVLSTVCLLLFLLCACCCQELETERVAFGDVVHAPPEVALKRKHWVTNSKAQQQQQQQQQGGRKATPGSSGKKHTSKQRPPKQQGAEVCWLANVCLVTVALLGIELQWWLLVFCMQYLWVALLTTLCQYFCRAIIGPAQAASALRSG
jgi:hypothetical protein